MKTSRAARRNRRNPTTGRASDHSKLYQVGDGTQLNIDRSYIGLIDESLPWSVDPLQWPLVRDVEPVGIGVHPARNQDGGVVPPYISRDHDEQVRLAVALAARDGGLVLLVGSSTAGKSRAAYEAMRAELPNRRLFIPNSGPELRNSILDLIGGPDKYVVWLDDLELYAGSNGLTSGLLRKLKLSGVAMVGTLRTEQYRRLAHAGEPQVRVDSHGHDSEGSEFQHLVEQGSIISIARRWSREEMQRASKSADPRIQEAASHGAVYGIAEYLAAGPLLKTQWELARDSIGQARGAAIVSAAIDLARIGIGVSVPIALIEELHEDYLQKEGGELLRPEPWHDALEWATRQRYGVTSFLLPGADADSWRIFDYLTDYVEQDQERRPIPEETWRTAIDYWMADHARLHGVALAASAHRNLAIAEQVWTVLADAGDAGASISLASILENSDRKEEAERRYRLAAGSNYSDAVTRLGLFLERAGRIEEAEEEYGKAANSDEWHGAFHLAQMLQLKGDLAAAEKWWRRASELRTASGADINLAGVLKETGRLAEAEEHYRAAIADGRMYAALGLGVLLIESDRESEGERWWIQAAEAGESSPGLSRGGR